jgi:hypothetical protein
MKKILIILLAIAMSSCSSWNTYYQVHTLESSETVYDEKTKEYFAENEDIKVNFDFWDLNGKLQLFIINKTGETIYIHLKESFIIKNNIADDYYDNTVSMQTDIYEEHDNTESLFGDKTYVTGSNYQEKKIPYEYLIIPSDAGRSYSYWNISGTTIKKSDYENTDGNFDENNSPLKILNKIAYTKGSKDAEMRYLSNKFWLASIYDFEEQSLSREVRRELLRRGKTNIEASGAKHYAPYKYYIEYKVKEKFRR